MICGYSWLGRFLRPARLGQRAERKGPDVVSSRGTRPAAACRKDFSLCTFFQHFPPMLITCAQSVTVSEGYFRAANFLESIFSE